MKKVVAWQAGIEDVRQLTFDFDAKLHSRLEEVFGKQTADRMWDGGEPFVVEEVITFFPARGVSKS